MVGEHQEIQLTDFGLAKVMSAKGSPSPGAPVVSGVSSGEQTTIGAAPGTPGYMAPEQACGQGDALDERCDVFGLGGILCEILTGAPPRTLADIAVLLRDCTDPNGVSLAGAYDRLNRCGGPAALVALCRQCLSFDPGQRPVSARAVADSILAYRAGLARTAEEEKLKAAQATVRAEAAVKRQKLAYGLLAAVVLLMLSLAVLGGGSGLAWSLYERRKAETTASATQRVDAWKELRAKAWAAPLNEIEQDLKDAREQANAGNEQARLGPASEALRQKTKDALAQADADLADAAKDRRLTERLLGMMVFGESSPGSGGPEAVVQGGLFDADRRYGQAFREWGLDPDRTPVEEAAKRIQSRPTAVATELIAALDHWAYLRRVHFVPSAQRLFDLANAADQPDRVRKELRELLATSEPPGGGEPGLNGERVQTLSRKVVPRSEPTLTLLVLANALWETGDQKTPLALLEDALENPSRKRDALLWGQLGHLHFSLGGMELGKQAAATRMGEGEAGGADSRHFQKAVVCAEVLATMRPEARFMLANALLYTDRKKGLELIEELQKDYPDDPDLQFMVDGINIQNLFLQGKVVEAGAALKKLAQQRRDDDAGHAFRLMAALIHLRQRELTEAEELCHEVCQAAKSPLLLAGAYELTGFIEASRRKDDEALKAFGEALRYSQGIQSGHVYLAQKFEQLDNLNLAKTCLAEGLKLDPPNAALLVYVIEFRQRHGQEDEAQAVRRLLPKAEFPTDARCLFVLGCGLMRIKEYKLAAEALEKHLEKDRDHTAARTMLDKAKELERSQKP
jgi:tetratricopeptide (TPR) repeat protein